MVSPVHYLNAPSALPATVQSPTRPRAHHWPAGTLIAYEVTQLLGVSERTLYRMIKRGELTPRRFAGRNLYSFDQVRDLLPAWALEEMQETQEEIREELAQ